MYARYARISVSRLGSLTLMLSSLAVGSVRAQKSTTSEYPVPAVATRAAPLVFDGATVIDIEHGTLVPDQRVVVIGNRIAVVGNRGTTTLPTGARLIDARGKYLIPGLWDMHTHVADLPQIFFPLFIANGVTGIRDMHESVFPFDSIQRWRRAILAGQRVGPRLVATGGYLTTDTISVATDALAPLALTVRTPAMAAHLVDSLKAAGVDFIKVREMARRDIYFAIAAAARRAGLPLVGHHPLQVSGVTTEEASDSGQRSIEHRLPTSAEVCAEAPAGSTDAAACRALVAHLQRNHTWLTPTLTPYAALRDGNTERARYWPRSVLARADDGQNGMYRTVVAGLATEHLDRDAQILRGMRRFGTPFLAGTDAMFFVWEAAPGFGLHDELAQLVEAGLMPLEALQAATLNPAQFFEATDTLGTVAQGKLADLVLLDADPLADIHNTTTIQAVVANGRYYDRATLDTLLAAEQAMAQRIP